LLDASERIPEEMLVRSAQTDILRILTEASKAQGLTSRWACAILRIMHILSHLENDARLDHFHHAREQIFSRLDPHVIQVAGRRSHFGVGPAGIPLVRYLKKERKDRNSILIKLLSKPQSIVEEVYDSLGVRFVTETRLDCYRLLQALFSSGAVCASNIQPGRSLNSLIPIDIFQQSIESIQQELDRGDISPRQLPKRLKRFEEEGLVSWSVIRNPSSSRYYRALQFTCRQLVVAPDPTFKFWTELRETLVKTKSTAALLRKMPITLRERRCFYYPFEVQIMDKASYVESIGGRSRHREYKARQRLMARNRVLRDLV